MSSRFFENQPNENLQSFRWNGVKSGSFLKPDNEGKGKEEEGEKQFLRS